MSENQIQDLMSQLTKEIMDHHLLQILSAPPITLPEYTWREQTEEEKEQKQQERDRQTKITVEVLEPLESQLCKLYHDNNIDGCPICHECDIEW